MTVSGPLVVLLQRGSWEERYQAVTLAVTAAALGDPVIVALFFEPLRLWIAGRFDEGAPASAAAARVQGLAESLGEARRELGLEIVACDTAVRLAGLDPDVVAKQLDRIATLPSLWKAGREGRVVVI
jgi:peroxiredoxin family protein